MGDIETRGRQLVHRLRMLGRGRAPEPGKAGPDTEAAPRPAVQPAAQSGTVRFLHRAYAEDNGDVAESYGMDDARVLRDHFDRYGQREYRGISQGDYVNVEGVVCCEDGHIFLSGWADRRMVSTLRLTVEIGYLAHDIGEIEASWYHRADVAGQIGDSTRPAGFMALVHVPGASLHSVIRLRINGKLVHEQKIVRWRAPDQFLMQTLTAAAVLADQPIGATLTAAERLYSGFHAIWLRFLEGLTFAQAFAHRGADPVDTSIVITIYKSADMLLPQLETLAAALSGAPIELVVIGNELQDSARVVDQLRGFCQIHDVALRLYLCSGNSGFSAANNFGADMARGETLIFMNPDIFPPEKSPEAALAFLTSDPGDALTGALLYYGDGMLMHSGMYVASDLAFEARRGRSEPVLRVEHFGKGLTHHIDDDSAVIEPIMAPIRNRKLLVTAALWKIRKSLFEEMGGLSTDYLYAYYEDADFCLRMLQAGHPVRIDESARWIHMEGVGKAKPPFVRSFMWLNRALFTRRFAASDLVADEDTDLFQL